ncbi:MAG TPA: flagellar biosynthesis anti-sigma factor FlgM [Acidobacteriaceae bacterium]|jgi:flagellar biosynthesis anti-sigma factor FlgM|nr:flagellar biosynthesis anti-sigma factor FlgM [Acidobacteriaceae bacterium]
MRIDLTNSTASQISSEPNNPSVNGQGVAPEAQSSEDRATLTSDQASVNQLVSTAMQTPEIRQDKVATLQQAISSGQYPLDPASIAASMLDEHA